MATATEYASPPGGFSRSSSMSAARSPDTASAIYPERAIRPLPKSRLKAKLSPEQASHIAYPPEPPPISPTLMLAGQEGANGVGSSARMTNGDGVHGRHQPHHPRTQHGHAHNHCTCGEDIDSGDEEVEFDHPDYRYAPPAVNGTGAGQDPVLDSVQRRLMDTVRPAKPPPPASAASSADGYESFENMSNKKKRKIPLSGTPSMHQSQLSAEMANMGISGPAKMSMADAARSQGAVPRGQHHPSSPASSAVNSGTGISGAGRGRYGRQVRRPLQSASMNLINPRVPLRRHSADAGIENTGGIISQAIKTAAEQGPLTPQKGQENGSLLQEAASSVPSGARTQFTFTMESESGNKMVDQQSAAAAAAAMATPTPQSRTVNGQPPAPGPGGKAMPGTAPRQPPPPRDPLSPSAPPKTRPVRRRSLTKQLALAAKEREVNQRYNNYHHRPTKDTMWICEFCEYESIFGQPPLALIRQYEAKDRKEQKKQAEKRRLLEKAKAKGRRGKKGSKKNNAANAAPAAVHGGQGQGYDPAMPPPLGPGEEDEYYDDEEYEGDEYDAIGGGGGHGRRGDTGQEEIEYDDDAYYRANPGAHPGGGGGLPPLKDDAARFAAYRNGAAAPAGGGGGGGRRAT